MLGRVSFIVTASILLFNVAKAEESYYCIQVESSQSPSYLVKKAKQLRKKGLPSVRVERINGFYTIRVGFWHHFRQAEDFLSHHSRDLKKSFVRKCYLKPERWIYPKKKSYYLERETTKNNKVKKKFIPDWEEEYKFVTGKLAESIRKEKENIILLSKEVSEKEGKTSSQSRFKGRWYDFFDARLVKGDVSGKCCNRERSLTNRIGYRFYFTLTPKTFLYGDFRLGLSYQRFREETRKKGWFSIRELYLQRNIGDFWNIRLGRVPLRDRRSFYYYNEVDGLQLNYSSALFNGMFFIGRRLNDNRFDNSDERIGINGYSYLILNGNYQYRYGDNLSLFYIKEYRGNSGKGTGDTFSVWKSALSETNRNWIGIRLTRDKDNSNYWADLSFSWGADSIVSSIYPDCSASKLITARNYTKNSGVGLELGAKKSYGDWGIGGRFAFGSKNFRLPRTANLKSYMFGFNRIRYYGELTDPDLRNIALLSLFGGKRLRPDMWLEANWINYWKVSNNRNTSFSHYFCYRENSDYLGSELDLMLDGALLGEGDKNYWRYLLTAGYFIPGSYGTSVLGITLRVKRYW